MLIKPIIGLEIHVKLLTKTKLFCGCSTKFGLSPNSSTCATCLGLPGSLPSLNAKAIALACKAVEIFNCTINEEFSFDRKHYWYPDLPKGYQITQHHLPLGYDGFLETTDGKICISRIQLEEDAGKSMYKDSEGLIDINRAGYPLIEIVTKPEITSSGQAKEFLDKLKFNLLQFNISDCKMHEGSLKCDVNINLSIDGLLTPIVEIKNLNSFKFVQKAIDYEINRQKIEYEKCKGDYENFNKLTFGWDDKEKVTFLQRRKEEIQEYCFFPDPDFFLI